MNRTRQPSVSRNAAYSRMTARTRTSIRYVTSPTFRPASRRSSSRHISALRQFAIGFVSVSLVLCLFTASLCGSYAVVSAVMGQGLALPDVTTLPGTVADGMSRFFGHDGILSGVPDGSSLHATGETTNVTIKVSSGEAARDQSTISVAPTYRSVLTVDEADAYDTLERGIEDGTYDGGESPDASAWPVIDGSVDTDELSVAWDAVTADDPYLTVRTGSMDRTIYRKDAGGIVPSPRYAVQADDDAQRVNWTSSPVTADEAVSRTREVAKAVADMCWRDAKGNRDEFVRRVFYYLSSTVEYADEDGGHTNDAYGALVLGRSKCWGMSCAMKAILDEKGIECRIVTGERSTGGAHAWNLVKTESGNWLACDVTNGSGDWHADTSRYSGRSYSDLYGTDGSGKAGDAIMGECMFGLSRMNSDYRIGDTSLRMLGWK